MRLLTPEELTVVTGGDDIVVTARYDYYQYGNMQNNPYGQHGNSSDPLFQKYMQWVAAYYTAQGQDIAIDNVGKQAAKDIAAKGIDHMEYSAFLYRDANGGVHESTIVAGNATDTGQHSMADYNIPDGSTLVGYIHNHPTYYGTDPNPNPNAAYTDNGDMSAIMNASSLAVAGHYTVDQDQYRGYILHGQTLDEYDYLTNTSNAASFSSGAANQIRPDIKPNNSWTI